MAASFIGVIAAPGLFQTIAEVRSGERPRALDIFLEPPTARNLHAFERNLEKASLVIKQLQPRMQYLEVAVPR